MDCWISLQSKGLKSLLQYHSSKASMFWHSTFSLYKLWNFLHIIIHKICWTRNRLPIPVFLGASLVIASKESACNARDLGLIPGLRWSSGEGKGYPLQFNDGIEFLVWMYLNLFKCFPMDQHFGCFQLVTIDITAVTILAHVPCSQRSPGTPKPASVVLSDAV